MSAGVTLVLADIAIASTERRSIDWLRAESSMLSKGGYIASTMHHRYYHDRVRIRLVIYRLGTMKGDTQSRRKLVRRPTREGEVSHRLEGSFDLLDEARGNFFGCFASQPASQDQISAISASAASVRRRGSGSPIAFSRVR